MQKFIGAVLTAVVVSLCGLVLIIRGIGFWQLLGVVLLFGSIGFGVAADFVADSGRKGTT